MIEALMAISVLMAGLLSMLSLLSKSFSLNRVTTDQAKATYLASEGVEIVKSLLDHDVYMNRATPSVGNGFGDCLNYLPPGWGGGFIVDYTTANCANAAVYTGQPLIFDPATHLYGYSPVPGGVTTNFQRRIRISLNPLNADELTVNAIVTWSTGPVTSQSINVEDHFYDWHP